MASWGKLALIVHSIIKRLKNEHTFLKNIQTEKAEEPFISTEREETKNPDISHLSFFALGMYNDQRNKSQKCALGTIKNCASNGLLSICISVPIMVLPRLPGIWHATGSKCTDQN